MSKMAIKFRASAEKLTPKIEACFAPRETNTPKKLCQAMNKRMEGQQLERQQKMLFALADLHEAGQVPKELEDVKSAAEVLVLASAKKEPVQNGYHQYYVETDQPSQTTDKAKAAWALLTPVSPEILHKRKIEQLQRNLKFMKKPGFFPTPAEVVERMIEEADFGYYQKEIAVLEPNGGSGAILDLVRALSYDVSGPHIAQLNTCEVDGDLRELLTAKGYDLIGYDFLDVEPNARYDIVLMNPPFENLADIDHVRHAYQFLDSTGVLVAIMSPGPFFRSGKKAESFRDWFAHVGGEVLDELPEGTFKESGTNVKTVMIRIRKEG